MNVLGFIFSLLLLFGFSFYAFWEKTLYSQKLCSSFVSRHIATREMHNNYEKILYKAVQKKNKTPKTSTTSEDPKKRRFLKSEEVPSCIKFNISIFLKEDQIDSNPLFSAFFQSSYDSLLSASDVNCNSFYQRFLNLAKKLYEKDPENFHFGKIDFKEKKLQRLYYSLLKGSPHYFIEKKGHPPLFNYLKIEPTESKICLSCATFDQLKAFFSESVAVRLWNRKETPLERLSIKKEELEQILLEEKVSFSHWHLLRFTHPKEDKNKLSSSGIDESCGIPLYIQREFTKNPIP